MSTLPQFHWWCWFTRFCYDLNKVKGNKSFNNYIKHYLVPIFSSIINCFQVIEDGELIRFLVIWFVWSQSVFNVFPFVASYTFSIQNWKSKMCKEITAKYNKIFISSASYGFYKELKSQANILSMIDRSELQVAKWPQLKS